MLLTNQGAAVERNNTRYKRMLKEWNCTKGKKRKISKRTGVWFNAIASIFKSSHAPRLHGHVVR